MCHSRNQEDCSPVTAEIAHRSIYRDFVAAWRHERSWKAIKDGYVRPHADFLRVFYRNFVDGEAFERKGCDSDSDLNSDPMFEHYRRHWAERPAECAALLERLSRVDPLLDRMFHDEVSPGGDPHESNPDGSNLDADNLDEMVAATTQRIAGGLQPRTDIDVVSLIGLGTTNACQLVYDGRPTVVLALDAWGRTFFDVELPWSDIPLWLSHELAHVIRYTEGQTAFRQFIVGGNLDYGDAIEHVSFIEFLVDEGLAGAIARTFGNTGGNAIGTTGDGIGNTSDEARVLGYSEEQLAWCRKHEDELWREVAPKLGRPLTMDGYGRYFSFSADDIPPRTAYYLGLRLVERYLQGTGIAPGGGRACTDRCLCFIRVKWQLGSSADARFVCTCRRSPHITDRRFSKRKDARCMTTRKTWDGLPVTPEPPYGAAIVIEQAARAIGLL